MEESRPDRRWQNARFPVAMAFRCAQRNAESGKVISKPISQPPAHSVGIIAATPDIPIVADKATPPIVPANFDSRMDQGAVVSDPRTVHGENAIRAKISS
jgi:hypothetical protein